MAGNSGSGEEVFMLAGWTLNNSPRRGQQENPPSQANPPGSATHLMKRSSGAMNRCCPLSQRGHVDDEAVLHIALEHPLVSLVDFLDPDQLDVADDVVYGAEIEHLLGFSDPADP